MHRLMDYSDLARPGRAAVIVIDPQQDFCSKEGAMARRLASDLDDIRRAVPHLNSLVHAAREASLPVVWVRQILSDRRMLPNQKALFGSGDDIWIIREDGDGINWYDELTKPLPNEPVVTKWMYDAFEDTDLHLLLQSNGIDTLIMTGFTTNVCVETTARHGFMKGYYIILASDCAGAPTQAEHASALHNIATYFGKVCTGGELAKLWSSSAPTSTSTSSLATG